MVEHHQLLDQHLHLAGRDLHVVGAGRADPHGSGELDDRFAVQLGGGREDLGREVGRIEHGLRPAFAIAEVDEEDAAEVAAGMDPAHEGDGLSGVRGPEFVAMLRAFHVEKKADDAYGAGDGQAKFAAAAGSGGLPLPGPLAYETSPDPEPAARGRRLPPRHRREHSRWRSGPRLVFHPCAPGGSRGRANLFPSA